jgi:multicomponent K+:H+ antiporter subunit A
LPLILIVLLPFLGAALPAVMIRGGRNAAAMSAGAVTLAALIGLLVHAPGVLRGEVVSWRLDWVPLLGLNANFFLDDLGLLFAGLILGIGLLIILYARFYLDRADPMGTFYTYLLLFQGAMLGIVLSDNVLILLIFWELTSLSSFLLIGYWKHLPEGRQGARMALAVTGMGGLALIGGMLILGQIAGSYDLTVILGQKEVIQSDPLYLPALVLILLGCFTKSAQFPFHFWLPHAMAAPTPVSAYLHSATMVKAGLFLMARLWPVLAGTDAWFAIVATTGLVTMVLGATIALFKDDLKALLAFSTVSQLGLVTMLLGFGSGMAAVVAVFHIVNHATFKAALFMTAGIVDHETGTRDIRALGGLWRAMPLTFVIATLAALSMAGVPFLNGFLSKEMMLEEVSHTAWVGSPVVLSAIVTIGALLSAAYSFRFVVHVFLGPGRKYAHPPHDPGAGLWLSPAILVVLVVVIGLFPAAIAGGIVASAAQAVIGGSELPYYSLKIWHGVTPALFMSVVALVGGAVLLALHGPADVIWQRMSRPDAKVIFDAIVGAVVAAARKVTVGLTNGSMPRYAGVFTLTVLIAGVSAWVSGGSAPAVRGMRVPTLVEAVGWLMLVAATVATLRYHHNRFLALVLISIIGLIVSVTFVVFSAPDLALTQAMVEVVTVILLLLALDFLPRHSHKDEPGRVHLRDATIAVSVGLAVALLTWAIQTTDFAFPSIAAYHLENAKTLGGGYNVVNVILVDFRGFDTYGEIIVLGIAALVIYAMTEALLQSRAGRRLIDRPVDPGEAGDRHPLMMVIATRVMMPIVLMVGVFIFLRGHNAPGGGFIAGLIVAIAFLMQYMASGFEWANERQRVPYHTLIGAGVLVASLTGIASWLVDRPFLTSTFGYVQLPFIKEFEVASAAAFDLGVFLCVLGAVMLALESLARLAHRRGERPSVHAMDVDPSRISSAGEG